MQTLPTIKCIEPDEGCPNQQVTLIGENFRDNLQVMFGSAAAYNTKFINPNIMRVVVPPRTSTGLVDVSLGCKDSSRNLCKLGSITFKCRQISDLEFNFNRLEDILGRICKEPSQRLPKEMILKRTTEILEKLSQNPVFQQISLQALADTAVVADLSNNLMNNLANNTLTINGNQANSINNSLASISSRKNNLNSNNLNNLISNTNMMNHHNQLGHHLTSNLSSITGSPINNNSVATSTVNQLNLMSNNLANNLSTNSNSNSSTGTSNSNNSTPTQMINSINHNTINHNALKYENAYENNVNSSSSTNQLMNNSSRNVAYHTNTSYISSQNTMQSAPQFLNYVNSFVYPCSY